MARKGYDLKPKYDIPKNVATSREKAKSIVKYLEQYKSAWQLGLDKDNLAEQAIFDEISSLAQKVRGRYEKIKDPYLPFYRKLGSDIQNFIDKLTNPEIKLSKEKERKEAETILHKVSDNIGGELLKISKIATSEVKIRNKGK